MSFNNFDSPITDEADDILGFKSLAKRISSSIVHSSFDTKNAFTISLEGKWGSGKTSLVNLIKKDLKNNHKDKIVIMEFNPWLVTDFEQLIKYFFSELLKEITYESFDAKLKEDIWKDIKKFVSFFTPDKVQVGAGDLKVSYNPKDTLFKEKDETLLSLKIKINDYLKNLNRRIVIIIDDIDRLTDKETEAFFRLIKGIADFNNIVYLLLYDKTVVAKSLETFKDENGEKYLDKIVQYSISVPKVRHTTLNKLLFEKLDNILHENPNHYFNQEKWKIVVNHLDNYIQNIRDINKVISVISFEYPQIAQDVNFVDFFILSLIKVQNYELYEAIKYNKHKFRKPEYQEEAEKYEEKAKQYFEKELKDFKKYETLLSFLIPVIDPYTDFYKHKKHQDKSIVYDEYFDNYFTFAVAENSFSQKEYSELKYKLVSANYLAFQTAILAINTPEKYNLFLEMFKDQDVDKYKNNKPSTTNIVLNLLSISLKLNTVQYTHTSYFYEKLALDIFMDSNDGKEVLTTIYSESNFVPLATKIRFLKDIQEYLKGKDVSLVENIEKVYESIKEKMKENVKDIKLKEVLVDSENKYLGFNGYRMMEALNFFNLSHDRFKEDINKTLFESRESFFEILDFFKSKINVNGTNIDVIQAQYIEKYVDLSLIDDYINKLDKESINDKEKNLINAWSLKYEYN